MLRDLKKYKPTFFIEMRFYKRDDPEPLLLQNLRFGTCRNCSHEVVLEGASWQHHIKRSKLYNVSHWPTGHVITEDCKYMGCSCALPELNQTKATKEKLVYLGRNIAQ